MVSPDLRKVPKSRQRFQDGHPNDPDAHSHRNRFRYEFYSVLPLTSDFVKVNSVKEVGKRQPERPYQ